jgi:DNA-binding NarL/FixJ family response regulator
LEAAAAGTVRLLVLHREAFVRETMAAALHKAGGLLTRACPPNPREAVELARAWPADVALVPVAAYSDPVVEALAREVPRARCLGLGHERDLALAPRLLRQGFAGLITFSADIAAVAAAVRAVASGYVVLTPPASASRMQELSGGTVRAPLFVPDGLSPRQARIVGLAAQGLTDAEIARVMGLSASSVRRELKWVLDKTGARTRAHLVALRVRDVLTG